MSHHPDRLSVPVAVVTGASRGIGAATAQRLALDGYVVVLAARTVGELEAVAASVRAGGGTSLVVPTDAVEPASLDALVSRTMSEYGRLDVIVNNAGVMPAAKRAERIAIEEWSETINVNLTAPWYLACRAKEAISAGGGGGVIVNITSTAARYPTIGFSSYNATKAALTMLTKSLALEWARDRIRVVGVAPGKVDTGMVRPIVAYTESKALALNPLGRIGAVKEVADLVAYLVSDRAAYITGDIVTIDGGEMLQH